MYHRERRKMIFFCVYALLSLSPVLSKNIITTELPVTTVDDDFENNIIDFDEDVSVKFNKKFGTIPWHARDKFNKESHRYTIDQDDDINLDNDTRVIPLKKDKFFNTKIETTTVNDYISIPPELLSTTDGVISLIESTEQDLTVIPLSTTIKTFPEVIISETVTLPSSTQSSEVTTDFSITEDDDDSTTAKSEASAKGADMSIATTEKVIVTTATEKVIVTTATTNKPSLLNDTNEAVREKLVATTAEIETTSISIVTATAKTENGTTLELPRTNRREGTVEQNDTKNIAIERKHLSPTLNTTLSTNNTQLTNKNATKEEIAEDYNKKDDPDFSSLEIDEEDVPDDYYDSKDVLPTTAPKTDAFSVIFGLAGSVVESVAERVVPKGIFDLFKRMQRQSEALEAERLRSREENGGLGQFGRGILKSISSGLKPLGQLMSTARDNGSLDTDRGFVSGLATGVSSVATSVADAFKDRVQAIYPGTVWCGDGHAAQARSSDLGLFFFTDTCCRQHDACRIYIRAGDTKYGLNNTGLFTRSHCSCDAKFRDCLKRTNSLVSAQIGLTYFNVLGPQCFRKAHPIVRCVRRTRITGQKCEEYELDYTKEKMWQWFDNETF